MSGFDVTFKNENHVSILGISGFLDAHTVPKFEASIQKLISESRYHIIVNLAKLDYISSAGLGVIMGFIEDVRQNGGDIKLSNMSAKVYKVFDLLGFPALFEIFDTESEAMSKFMDAV
jgi:anti-sigma B factor antagonist